MMGLDASGEIENSRSLHFAMALRATAPVGMTILLESG
jgi:hypothetical protein